MEEKMKKEKKSQADSVANQEAKIEASEAKAENPARGGSPSVGTPHWDTERDLSTLMLDMTFNLAVELDRANKKIEELEMKLTRFSK
jgi:hypothetical protein